MGSYAEMWKKQVWQNVARVALGLGAVSLLGVHGYLQYQNIGDLQRQIDRLPDGKDKTALVKDRIALENTIAGSVIQAVGGLLLFVTAYVSIQNLKATQRNVLVAEEKQVTERFTQAINQLGSAKIEVRLGGIYALERIAKDSPRDHWTIIEVLTSFIKVNSPLLEDSKQTLIIAEDVQAALTVIGRRDEEKDPQNERINLSETSLIGADLRNAKLSKANLQYVDLRSTDLCEANLRGTILVQAGLMRAELEGADLEGANLTAANLEGAYLQGARNLNIKQVQTAHKWKEANYNDAFRRKLGLPPKPTKP